MKILIAEDDAVSRRVLEGHLVKWGYEVLSVENGEEAWTVLQEADAPQLAILDWMMPRMDGVEICRRLRQRGPEPYVYALLLTAKGQKQDIIEGIEAGADDYLTKPYDPGELQARLRSGRRILALQEALISARDALRFEATHDPLTGLWNRLATTNTLARELVRGARHQEPLSVILADLDHFKNINDTYGHLTGDTALRAASGRILSAVRAYDTVGRFGGEEFLVILPECDLPGAANLAERIRGYFAREPFDLPEGGIPLFLSLGVAGLEAKKGVEPNSLIWAADQALHRAKARGRNCVERASQSEISHCTSSSAPSAPPQPWGRNGERAA
jgi:diguanylate cyclase (GGDEF)-like protein